MLIRFFLALRSAGLPVSTTEFLGLLGALRAGVAPPELDQFHALARTCLVKDESRYDLYDRVFGAYFKGIEALAPDLLAEIPQEWLRRQAELLLSDEEKAATLQSQASQRGLRVDDEVIGYMLRHTPRDLPSLMAVLDELDRASREHKRPVTVPLLKEMLNNFNRTPKTS